MVVLEFFLRSFFEVWVHMGTIKQEMITLGDVYNPCPDGLFFPDLPSLLLPFSDSLVVYRTLKKHLFPVLKGTSEKCLTLPSHVT